jgi:hypothetical protein
MGGSFFIPPIGVSMFNFFKGQSVQPHIQHSSQDAMDALLQIQKEKQEELKKLKEEHDKRQAVIDAKKKEAELKQKAMMAVVEVQKSIKQMTAQLDADVLASDEADLVLEQTDADIWEMIQMLRNAS